MLARLRKFFFRFCVSINLQLSFRNFVQHFATSFSVILDKFEYKLNELLGAEMKLTVSKTVLVKWLTSLFLILILFYENYEKQLNNNIFCFNVWSFKLKWKTIENSRKYTAITSIGISFPFERKIEQENTFWVIFSKAF